MSTCLTQFHFQTYPGLRGLQAGKNSRIRIKIQGRLMQTRFIEIHQVFTKKKFGYIFNKAILLTCLVNYISSMPQIKEIIKIGIFQT